MALNLGNIVFGLAANTQGLETAVSNVQNFGSRVTNTVRAARGQMDEVTRALARQEASMVRGLQNIQNQIHKINSMPLDPKVRMDAINRMEAAYTDFVKRMNTRADRPLNALSFGRTNMGFKEQIDDINRFVNANKLANRSGMDFISTMRGIGSAIELSAGPLNGFVFRIRAATELMSRYGVVAGATAGAVIGLGTAIFGLGSEIIRASMEFQRANIMLTATTGNSAVAATQMNYVRDVSMQAGLAFAQTAKDFARYSAAATAAGTATGEVRKQFAQMAMISGTLQLAQQDVSGVMRALEQIMSKGTVQSEELRGQLGDRMPAAFAIAAQAVGKTTAQLSDMLKKGEVISKDFVPAFLDAAVKFYNIDMSKPIDSLQASLSRLQSRWDLFLVALDRATGFSRAFQMAVDALSNGLRWMTENINVLVSSMGAMAGALAGLMIASIVATAVSVLGTAFTALNAALAAANGGLRVTTALLIALNTMMGKTPVGKLISLLVSLGAALLGAKLGYDAVNHALAMNQAAMADTSSINSYIRAQQQLGYNIRSVTNDLIQQQNALAQSTRTQMMGKWNEMKGLLSQRANLEAAIEGAIPGQNVAGFAARLSEINKKANELAPELKGLADNTKLYAQSVQDLNKLNSLPEQRSTDASGGGGKGGGKGGRTPDPERGLESIRDMILGAQKAQDMLDRLFAGPSQVKLIEDLYKVKDATDKLDPDQLAQMRKYLDMPNATLEQMQNRLVEFVTAGRQANDVFREFSNIWDTIKEGQVQLEGFKASMDFLARGGDPEKMYIVQASVKAAQAIKTFQENGAAGQKALEALRKELDAVGYAGMSTQDALAKFFASLDEGEDQVQRLVGAMRNLKDDMATLQGQQAMMAGIKMGAGLQELLHVERIVKAKEALKGLNQEGLAEMSRQLTAAGFAGDNAILQWANMQRQIERNNEIIERHIQLLEDNKQAWMSLGDSAVDTLESILDGSKSLKEGLVGIFKDLAGTLYDVGIRNPFRAWLEGTMNGTGGGLPNIGGLFGGRGGQNAETQDAANSIMKLGSASDIVARLMGTNSVSALQQNVAALVMGHGAQTANTVAMGQATSSLFLLASAANAASMSMGGSSVGGWLGKAFNIVQSVISPGLDVRNIVQNDTFKSLPVFPRAAGGPMMKGHMYRINETGTDGDLFMPGKSGWAVPNSQLNSQSRTIIIDASIGSIDARGATPDAIDQLRQELRARDARLRAELPAHIDSRIAENNWRGRS